MTDQHVADTPLRAELYLSGNAAGFFDIQQQVVNRVERLEANGMFSESIVAGVWQRIQVPAEDPRSEALATYEEFREWARNNGYSLAPAFDHRTRTHLGTDRSEDVVAFPGIALALYDEQDLTAVFPCTDEERTYKVEDALDAFEQGNEDWLTHFDAIPVERTEPVLGAGDVPAASP